jgi:hypothetical protein
MRPRDENAKKIAPLPDELVLTDFSTAENDASRPVTSVSDGTTVAESLDTSRSDLRRSDRNKNSASKSSKSSLLRFVPTFFEGFQEHIKSRTLNACMLMIFPAVLFVFFGSPAWIDTAPFSSPDSIPSLKSIFIPSFPLFIGKPAPEGFHPRLLISNRYTWPLANVIVECSLETFALQGDIANVFPECGPHGDHSTYPFCISPQVSFQNISNNDGIVELVSFHIHGLPGAYKIKCSADVSDSQYSAAFWVSIIGSVSSVHASFADTFSQRIRLDTCGIAIPLPKVVVGVKNVDPSPISRRVFIVALQYPALVALELHKHDDFASFAPGSPIVGIEHSSTIAEGDLSTSISPFLVSWSANAFVLAVVCEGRYNVLSYLQAPFPSKFNPPSQHIVINSCPTIAQLQLVRSPPTQVDSTTPFSLSVRITPAPLAPIRALLFAYCPKCLDGTIQKSGILWKSKKLYSKSSDASSRGSFTFDSAYFTSAGEAGLYFYAVAAAGHIFPISASTDVLSPTVLMHLWAPTCIIDCNSAHVDVGRAYFRHHPNVNIRFASGASAPSRNVRFIVQSTASKALSRVVVDGSVANDFGSARWTSFALLVFKADVVGPTFLSSKSGVSSSNAIPVNRDIRYCANSDLLCSFIEILQGFPERVVGGTLFSGIIQGSVMSAKGDGIVADVCIFFEGISSVCATSDSTGNVNFTNVFIPIPISSEASSLVIWYLAENSRTLHRNVSALKRQCGYFPACTSFTMATFVTKNSSSFFNISITNGRLLTPDVYGINAAFRIPPTVALQLSCIFVHPSFACDHLTSYTASVTITQFKKSIRATASESEISPAQCSHVVGSKVVFSCTLLQGIIWAQLEIVFGGHVFREIYVHVSDASVIVESYAPKYPSILTRRDSDPLNALSSVSMVGGSIQYVNNLFFSAGIFAPLQHPALTLRINGTNIDVAISSSNVIDQTLDLSTPAIDRSVLKLPDAPNLINGSRVEIFSRIDAPVNPGVYSLQLCFESHRECFSHIVIPSLTVVQPSLHASALVHPDFAVLSMQGGNAPFFSARVNEGVNLGGHDSDRWDLEPVLWSLHDSSKTVISSGVHSSALKKYTSTQAFRQWHGLSPDLLSGDELFAEFLPVSFTPPPGYYMLSAAAACCGQRIYSNKFLVDYSVQSVSLMVPPPHNVVTSQSTILSVDVRALSGSGLPGRLVAITSNSDLPATLCHASACYAITNSFGIANVEFSVSLAVAANHSFRIQSGNKAVFFHCFVSSEVEVLKITKDFNPTGSADVTAQLPCAAALTITSALILTSKPENDWASYNFPEFRVTDSAGNGVPGLVASLRLLQCSLDGPDPSFVPSASKFTIRKIRSMGDGGSYAIDQFSFVKEFTTTDVYKLEITLPGLRSVTTAPFLVRSVELPDPVAISTLRTFLMVGLPVIIMVLFANMRQRHIITFIIATGSIGFYTLIALIYCSDALTFKGLNRAPSLMIGSMAVMLSALGLNCAICGVVLATYMVRTDYYDSHIREIMKGLSALLTKVQAKPEDTEAGEAKAEGADTPTPSENDKVVDLDAIIEAESEKPPIWRRLIAFFASKQVAMTNKSQAEIIAEINAKKRKAMALLFKASGKQESVSLAGFSFHSRMFSALTVSFIALLASFLICTTMVDWFEVLLGLGRAKVVQSRWRNVRPDASQRVTPPLLFAPETRLQSIANQSIGPQGVFFAVM